MSLRQPGRRAHAPNYQLHDEVRIVTLPRFKSSAVSGSEWRIRARVELLYKGVVQYTSECASVDEALRDMPLIVDRACTSYMTPTSRFHGNHDHVDDGEPRCDQEGCAALATCAYRVLHTPCKACGAHDTDSLHLMGPRMRYFCARHSYRGEGYLDDTQSNYELVAGTPPTMPAADDVATVGAPVLVYANDDDDDDDDSL